MAIINKIRENSGLAIAVVTVALVAFIVGDSFMAGGGGGGGGMFGGNSNVVGEINGHTVDYQHFSNLADFQRIQYEGSVGRPANDQEQDLIRNQVWEQFIFENVFLKEFNSIGITISDDELREMIQGPKNIHPFVMQQFSDQNGNFDAITHENFIAAYANNTMPEEQRMMWDEFKRELKNLRMREKYANLLASSSYITKAEAKAEYQNTNTTASGKYLFVPYFSVSDSSVKVSDAEIKDYYSKHANEFTPYDNRSVTYALFSLLPTAEDSLALLSDLRELSKGLAVAEDPIDYANSESDIRTAELRHPNELSPEVNDALSRAFEGSIIGPFKEGSTYSIYKYLGNETDPYYTARASHILFRTMETMSDEEKAEVRKRANEILDLAKTGLDFGMLASQYSEDGSAQNGGDLGAFQNNGMMVKPFEDAVFGFNGEGVLPNLVTTDFGYHIINVTEAKTNLKYRLATISKELLIGDEGANNMFHKVNELKSRIKTVKDLEEAAKNDESITLLTAPTVAAQSSRVNTLNDAKSIVQWAYGKDAKVGQVADQIFDINDYYVIAGLTAKAEKESPKANDFKDMIVMQLTNKKKAEQIMAKLGNTSGDLNEIASRFGAGALVDEVENITFQTGMLANAGFDPVAVGKFFGLKPNTRSDVFAGDSGVFIVETTDKNTAPEIADYSQYKEFIKQRSFGDEGMIGEEILREKAKIKDNRARFF